MRWSSHGDDRTLACICAPDNGAPDYLKPVLVEPQAEMTSEALTPGDFNTPLTSVRRSSRRTVNREVRVLNVT